MLSTNVHAASVATRSSLNGNAVVSGRYARISGALASAHPSRPTCRVPTKRAIPTTYFDDARSLDTPPRPDPRVRASPSPSRGTSARPYRTRSAAAKAAQSPNTASSPSRARPRRGHGRRGLEPLAAPAARAFAAAVAANITLFVGPALAGDPNKVVTVPYVKYEVTSASSAEAVDRQGAERRRALYGYGARTYRTWRPGRRSTSTTWASPTAYQNAPDGRADVTKPDAICEGHTSGARPQGRR